MEECFTRRMVREAFLETMVFKQQLKDVPSKIPGFQMEEH